MSRISSIADFGPPEEIADCVQFLGSEKAVEKLLRKAMDHGVAISPVQIMELEGLVDEETLTRLAVTAKAPFSADQLEGLEGLIDDEVLFALDKKAGTNLFCEEWDDDWDEEEEDAPKLQKPSFLQRHAGLVGLFAGMAASNLMEKDRQLVRRFRIGDHVRVRFRGQEGTVVDINGSLYMVSLNDGGYVDSYYEDQLERAW